jgi:hypothetical protein
MNRPNWDRDYVDHVYLAPRIAPSDFPGEFTEIRVEYDTLEGSGDSFVNLAHWAGAMDNIKANVPRTAYKGIVSVWKEGVKVHIAPRTRI